MELSTGTVIYLCNYPSRELKLCLEDRLSLGTGEAPIK